MSGDPAIDQVISDHEIRGVVTRLFYSRDRGKWEELKTCFHEGARVSISWFQGSGEDFCARSRVMVERHKPGELNKHMMGNHRVRIVGNRAVSECDVILHQRRFIDGYEFDLSTWSQYLDLFERRGGSWRIVSRTAIYEKDRMDPHNAAAVPPSYFEEMDLSKYPPNIRYHCFRNDRAGYPHSPHITLSGTDEERAAREAGERWLAGSVARPGFF